MYCDGVVLHNNSIDLSNKSHHALIIFWIFNSYCIETNLLTSKPIYFITCNVPYLIEREHSKLFVL